MEAEVLNMNKVCKVITTWWQDFYFIAEKGEMEAPQKDIIKCNVQSTRCNKYLKKDNKKALRFEYDSK